MFIYKSANGDARTRPTAQEREKAKEAAELARMEAGRLRDKQRAQKLLSFEEQNAVRPPPAAAAPS